MLPESEEYKPTSNFKSVDFPAPFAPTTPIDACPSAANDISFKIGFSFS
jgi:hypothetical protein